MTYFKPLVCISGALICVLIVFASNFFNYMFGASLGKTEIDSQVYGGLLAALDWLKVSLPFIILWCYKERFVFGTTLGVSFLGILMIVSFCSSIGYSASNRLATQTTETVQTSLYHQTKLELKANNDRLATIQKNLNKYQVIFDKRGYLRRSETRDKNNLIKEKQTLKSENKQYKKDLGLGAVKINQNNTVTAQIAVISEFLSIKGDLTNKGSILILSLVIETLSAFGIWLCLAPLRTKKKQPVIIAEKPIKKVELKQVPSADVIDFFSKRVDSNIVKNFLARTNLERFTPLEGWHCFQEKYKDCISQSQFYKALKEQALAAGFSRKKIKGQNVYVKEIQKNSTRETV